MKKLILPFLAVILAAASLVGCSGTPAASSSAVQSKAVVSAASDTSAISGQVTCSGSSALQPLVQAAADSFQGKNQNVSVMVNAGGSGTGLQNVSDKTVDIGDSDIFAEEKLDSAKASALEDHIVCVVGVAAVVNPKVDVSNVTKRQLLDIFTGKTKNWKELGGKDQKIVIINRPVSSGTRALFKKYALDGKDEAKGVALTEDNSGILKQNVTQTPGAIAYLAFSYLTDNTVKSLSIEGVKPTYGNIYSGKYGVWGYEHMYTYGKATGAAKAFLDYIQGPDCEKIIAEKGYGLSQKMTVKRSAPSAKQ